MQHAADIKQQIWFSADRQLAAADVKMGIEHCIDKLAPLPPIFHRNRFSAYFTEERDEVVIGREPAKTIEEPVGNTGFFLHRLPQTGAFALQSQSSRPRSPLSRFLPRQSRQWLSA